MPADYKPNSSTCASRLDEGAFRLLSRQFRRSILAYGCKPNQVRLLLVLCDETFDANQIAGRVDLIKWGLALQMRADKLQSGPWTEVCNALIVDFDPGIGAYQLRPDIRCWSRIMAGDLKNLSVIQELPLVGARPLSESLSELSREAVLKRADLAEVDQPRATTPDEAQSVSYREGDFKRLSAAIASGTVDVEFPNALLPAVAEKSAAVRRKNPPQMAEKSAVMEKPTNQRLAKVAEKSATIRSDLIGTKDLILSVAEKSAAAWTWLSSIDANRALALRTNRSQWEKLCRSDPDYVLERLRLALEAQRQKGREITNPLRYVAATARNDKRL